MSRSKSTISSGSKALHDQNGSTGIPKTREEVKAQNGAKGRTRATTQPSPKGRSCSNKTLKVHDGGKLNYGYRAGGATRSSNLGGFDTDSAIKVPKPKANRRQQLSRAKKYELEKQTLLIMDQMISHVKDFTTKERYFDYKKISSNIKLFDINHADCKKMWEQFKSRLRGQFKEGNEEMRQCRNECNEDFWTHHYRSYGMRLHVYNKMTTHPDIIEDLRKLSDILVEQDRSHIHNELLELNENEEKLVPVLEDFDRLIKTSDDQEELDQLDEVIQALEKEFETSNPIPQEGCKRKYQSKDETEIFNSIMNRIYTELSLEYEKRVYNPESEIIEPQSEPSPISESVLKILGYSEKAAEEEINLTQEPKISEKSNKQWSELEILRLLRGIYQYGETKWLDICNSYEFYNKSPHDLSVKWMNIRYQMVEDLKRLNKKHQN